jgi:periplasmic protein TonB
MFEDSTFESMGKIHTRSGGWMMATLALNATVLLSLILIPLLDPEALPHLTESILMEAPTPPAEAPKPPPVPAHAVVVQPQVNDAGLRAPSVIPPRIFMENRQEVAAPINVANWGGGAIGSPDNPFPGRNSPSVVQQKPRPPAPISSGVMNGYLVFQAEPVYPPIAKASGTQGTVVLQATISKNGTIENLRVTGGPIMLQQAALEAVKQWRYRPYLLNGEPIEVETTVNVVFKLD